MILMDVRRAQADILNLLRDSPIVDIKVGADIKELVHVGEIGLAFDTLCSWLYEDSLPISTSFFERLQQLSRELDAPESMERLHELVINR